jgi:hypothetical protein
VVLFCVFSSISVIRLGLLSAMKFSNWGRSTFQSAQRVICTLLVLIPFSFDFPAITFSAVYGPSKYPSVHDSYCPENLANLSLTSMKFEVVWIDNPV